MRCAVGILPTAIVPVFVASMTFAADPYGSESGTAHEHATAGATAGFMGEHTMTGRITDIDKDMGRVKVNSEGQEFALHFPKTALQSLKKGDQVTVSLGIKPAGSTAGTRGTSGAGTGMPSPRGTGDYPPTSR